ncbi:helix-hairpin-helix domain-containing protein [Pseudarthrobacter sp. PS3-L1]|uniref:ComEA family DNA-binding protein n=1 Tax=Pseudarthrobacter sp. PS3-L1 TaxID=3046207 RepID=UPI0024BBA462|nr:helix-hairpin-helix domain-containing protein [Pseudarthrobacter sp. PS3-L1]MDJ0320086.1 helix-hairpin-helix domain-containing protein [Pseudarthrobacter sp. PS3-L1]
MTSHGARGPRPESPRHVRDRLHASLGSAPGLLEPVQGGRSETLRPLSLKVGDEPAGPLAGDDVPAVRIRFRLGVLPVALAALLCSALAAFLFWQSATSETSIQAINDMESQTQGKAVGPSSMPGGESASPLSGPGSTGTGSFSSALPEPDGTGHAGQVVVVHVAGAVLHPGIVVLPAGSRVHQALDAAGGAAPDGLPDELNLAEVLTDGQKIRVRVLGEDLPVEAVGQPPVTGSRAGPTAGGILVNLNTATLEELGTLPRVGPVLAQRIIDWRTAHGVFGSVEELDAVEGVGPKMLESLLPLVRVS